MNKEAGLFADTSKHLSNKEEVTGDGDAAFPGP